MLNDVRRPNIIGSSGVYSPPGWMNLRFSGGQSLETQILFYLRRTQDNGRLRRPVQGLIVFPFGSALVLYEKILVDTIPKGSRLFGYGVW